MDHRANRDQEAGQTPLVTRRTLMSGLVAAALLTLEPRYSARSGLTLFPEAQAWVWAAIGVALSAYSAFSHSDNGLGDMLSAGIQLSKENIRLSKEIINALAQVQRDINTLPERLKQTMIEVAEYDVRAQTQTMAITLEAVQKAHARESTPISEDLIKARLTANVQSGATIAGKSSVPYGRGPVAAFCAPVCMGAAAKSLALLGASPDNVRDEIASVYMPWLDSIRNPSMEGSVANLMVKEGAALKAMQASFQSELDGPLTALVGDAGPSIVQLEPGDVLYKHLQCLVYQYQTSSVRRCTRWQQPPRKNKGSSTGPVSCAEWVNDPQYSSGVAIQEWLRVLNNSTEANGPAMTAEQYWGETPPAEPSDRDKAAWTTAWNASEKGRKDCAAAARESQLPTDVQTQKEMIQRSKVATDTGATIETLNRPRLANIVDQRTIVWTYFRLLQENEFTIARTRKIFGL